MNGKVNTPRTVCKAIIAVAIAAIAVAAIIGCSSLGGGSRRQNIATVIQTAYDLGGREAVSNKIESLVAEGKLTPSQAVRLHALAQLAYEGIMDDLAGGGAATNAVPASAPPRWMHRLLYPRCQRRLRERQQRGCELRHVRCLQGRKITKGGHVVSSERRDRFFVFGGHFQDLAGPRIESLSHRPIICRKSAAEVNGDK